VRFETSPELRLFADSMRSALAGWEAPREPTFGTWWDEHDDALAARLAGLGWADLWEGSELRGAAVAGGLELGRVIAPQSLVDNATLGGALAVAGSARHLAASHRVALVTPGGALVLDAAGEAVPMATLDGTGTMRIGPLRTDPAADSAARLSAWGVATLAYLAGLAEASLDATVAYVSSREQFGAPLAALPTMQARLADAALAADGLELVAWEAAARDADDEPLPPALIWAGAAAREVTAIAHQAHGGVGFALESGVHRAYRRAKSAQVWIAAVVEAAAHPEAKRLG
jgi:hypothetical protein